MIKVALIGSSGHSFTALNAIRRHRDELRLVGISSAAAGDIAPDKKCLIAQEFDCAFFADYRRMLDETKPDIACVDSRFDQNGPVSAECLRRGIHCYTEKTVAHSAEVLAELRQAAAAGSARLIGMHTMRYDAHFYAAWKAIKAGAIGQPRLVIGRKSYKFGASRPDFYRHRDFYGGTILWVAVHALDLVWWTAGEFDVVSALHSALDNFGYGDCETACALSLAGNGFLGTVTADFYQPTKAESHGDDQLRLAGPGGVVEVLHGKAWLTTHDAPRIELPLEEPGDFFYDYAQELQGRGRCRLSMEETLALTEVALRARDLADAFARK